VRLLSLVVPVLEDALESALSLAASMDARGYGRAGGPDRRRARLSSGTLVLGLVMLMTGTYAALDARAPGWMGWPLLALGLALCVVGSVLNGRDVRRTVYRPDPWLPSETVTVLAGLIALVGVVVVRLVDPSSLVTSASPPEWPALPGVMVALLLVAALPAVLTPRPPKEDS